LFGEKLVLTGIHSTYSETYFVDSVLWSFAHVGVLF
jgi:hypothetical protein